MDHSSFLNKELAKKFLFLRITSKNLNFSKSKIKSMGLHDHELQNALTKTINIVLLKKIIVI